MESVVKLKAIKSYIRVYELSIKLYFTRFGHVWGKLWLESRCGGVGCVQRPWQSTSSFSVHTYRFLELFSDLERKFNIILEQKYGFVQIFTLVPTT